MLSRLAAKSCLLPLAAMACLLALGLCGCGGMKGEGTAEDDGVVVVQGIVSSRGNTPFSLITIEATSGKMYLIEDSYLAEELRALDGMEVSIRGNVVPQSEGVEHPSIHVMSYELLALPSGELPVVGVIRPGGLIEDTNLVIWVIKGDFEDVLKTFVGAKVWVVGVPMQSVDTPQGTFRTMLVTEYGVIRQ